MLNHHSPQPGRLDRSGVPGLPPRLSIHVDRERAPITFGWALYAQRRFAGRWHLETLYRLDRVGAQLGRASVAAALQPSEYYGQCADALGAILRVRQHALLPAAPPGCRWIGPQLIEDVPVPASFVCSGPGQLGAAAPALADGGPCQDCSDRLQFARRLAASILQRRASP